MVSCSETDWILQQQKIGELEATVKRLDRTVFELCSDARINRRVIQDQDQKIAQLLQRIINLEDQLQKDGLQLRTSGVLL
jgi:hypothetical protein